MAVGLLTLPEIAEADALAVVLNSGEFHIYVDIADKLVKSIDSIGTVRVLGPGVANALATSGAPVIIDGSIPPVAGQSVIATDPTTAGWAYQPGIERLGAAESTAFTITARAVTPVDISGGSFIGTLPLANSVPVDTVVTLKLVNESSGNLLTIQRAGSDTIDNFDTPITSVDIGYTDGEVMRLRSDGASIWYRTTLGNIVVPQFLPFTPVQTFTGTVVIPDQSGILVNIGNIADIPIGVSGVVEGYISAIGINADGTLLSESVYFALAFDGAADTPTNRLAAGTIEVAILGVGGLSAGNFLTISLIDIPVNGGANDIEWSFDDGDATANGDTTVTYVFHRSAFIVT